MAKFISNYEVEGSLRNQTYYKTRGKFFIKRKGGVNRDRILTDKNFARTRENGSEFGIAARAGKLLRYAFAAVVRDASDSLVTSRLTQRMAKVKNEDTESIRGERSVAIGITTDAGKALLIDFNFNKNAVLKSVLHVPYALDTATGVITITGLVPLQDVTVPDGATHITFTGAMGVIDFENAAYKVDYTNEVNLPYNTASTDVILTPIAVPAGTGATFYLLHIAFFQQVNSIQYPLNNGGFNALAIIDVQS
jgi:hypothetical protein